MAAAQWQLVALMMGFRRKKALNIGGRIRL
jgi:hypothetical protein